jgi:pantetheine-phosphate adenylyltransferase
MSQCSKLAVYPGTFDPPTNGHMDVARRALAIFDGLVIGVSTNLAKKPVFDVQERVSLLRELFSDEPRIVVKSFDGLLMNFVKSEGAISVVRGLRAVSDFEYELQMATFNSILERSIGTVFFMASEENIFVSSSVIKEISKFGGDISTKVHPAVLQALREKFGLDRRVKQGER